MKQRVLQIGYEQFTVVFPPFYSLPSNKGSGKYGDGFPSRRAGVVVVEYRQHE
jgi:hypothetical protein